LEVGQYVEGSAASRTGSWTCETGVPLSKDFVAEHRLERRQIGVGAQHEDAIELGVLFRLAPIDGEMIVARRRQKTTIAFIAARLLSPFFSCR
jgi:hypothetical protein